MKKYLGVIVLIIVLAGGALFLSRQGGGSSKVNYDAFASCLAEKNLVMYGAYWCSHCQNQKKLFGDSFKNVKYVECTENADLCQQKGVKGYPTWILADGAVYTGEQSLEQLAQITSCELPK